MNDVTERVKREAELRHNSNKELNYSLENLLEVLQVRELPPVVANGD
jgi:hypothetical protein